MPLEREIRAIELQKETTLDDRLVFDLDGGSDGGEICLFAVLIFVLHRSGNDPGDGAVMNGSTKPFGFASTAARKSAISAFSSVSST
jgi:hypothetical protein